jgi:hypothetical protein
MLASLAKRDLLDRAEAVRPAAKQPAHIQTQPSIKVFVSYARADLAFADKLVGALEAHSTEVRIDRRDLPFARVWQDELVEMVRWADTVLFIISPDAIASKWCEWELAQVVKHQQRLGPIVYRPVENDRIPEELSKLQHISFAPPIDFDTAIERLVEQLGTDIDWVRHHTDLADAARDWKQADQSSDFLLRGAALRGAQSWLDARPPTAPAPTAEQLELITASQRASGRRRWNWTLGVIAVAAIAIGLAGLAYWQREVAIANEETAKTNERIARQNEERANAERDQALRRQSLFLAEKSQQESERGNGTNGILLALEALPKDMGKPDRPYVIEAEIAAFRALQAPLELAVLEGHGATVWSVAFSPDGTRLASGSSDDTVRLWDVASGQETARLEGHGADVNSVAFSPDGTRLASGGDDDTVRLWDMASGQQTARLEGHGDGVGSVAFSPDGTRLASGRRGSIFGGGDNAVHLWDVASGQETARLEGHGD